MIASFFQSLNEANVEYLLISGQATVLYGAATFSEDIDLWINPTSNNRKQFLTTLQAFRAHYYKLTPAFTLDLLVRGHGFHFVFPSGSEPPVFLDVMGKPPRGGSFEAARSAANWMDTEWGQVLTIGIKELVELKKTQRLEDYPVISRLALAWFEQTRSTVTPYDYKWATQNIFTLTELKRFFQNHIGAVESLPVTVPKVLCEFAQNVSHGTDVKDKTESEVVEWMQQRIQNFQQQDRHYWREIIAELRQLYASRQLMPEGASVST